MSSPSSSATGGLSLLDKHGSSLGVPALVCSGHSRPVKHIQYSNPSSTITQAGTADEAPFYLLSSSLDGKAQIRNGINGDWIGTLVGHKGAINHSTWSKDNSLISTSSADYTCKIWDSGNGECKINIEHPKIVKASAFTTGSQLITAATDKLIRLFDLSTLPVVVPANTNPTASTNNNTPSNNASSTAASTNTSAQPASASASAPSASSVPSASSTSAVITMKGHNNGVKSIIYNPAKETEIISIEDSDKEAHIYLWDVRDKDIINKPTRLIPVSNIQNPHTFMTSNNTNDSSGGSGATSSSYRIGGISSMELSSDNQTISVSANNKHIYFLDATTYNVTAIRNVGMECSTVSLHPTRSRFVVGSDFHNHVFDFQSNKKLETHKGHHGPVHCVRYAPDGNTFASASEDGTIRIILNDSTKPYGLWQFPASTSQ